MKVDESRADLTAEIESFWKLATEKEKEEKNKETILRDLNQRFQNRTVEKSWRLNFVEEMRKKKREKEADIERDQI